MLNIKNIYKIIKNKTLLIRKILSSLSYKFVYCKKKKKKNEKKLQERIP